MKSIGSAHQSGFKLSLRDQVLYVMKNTMQDAAHKLVKSINQGLFL